MYVFMHLRDFFCISHQTVKRWVDELKQNGLQLQLQGNTNRVPPHALSNMLKDDTSNWITSFANREGEQRPGQWRNNGQIRDTDTIIPSHYTFQAIYERYKSENENVISYSTFKRLFDALPIKIQAPKSDVCNECIQLKMKIANRLM
eukprot:NODE_542_length_6882_cov_0.127967.p4 type:complete len:147 gc:universal NODE_542_length_6882_cov_0.127967:2541-2101(-)